MTRIGLGTVQLGVPYGPNQGNGLLSKVEAIGILQNAAALGIFFFDTAAGYGESEARIGESRISEHFPEVEISTKLSKVDEAVWKSEVAFERFAAESIERSLNLLKLKQVGLLQLHQCDVRFLENKSVIKVLASLIERKMIRQLGVSVYDLSQAEAALALPFVSALQVPVNILDQRFLSKSFLGDCAERKVLLIARSILLQGVLVDKSELPPVSRRVELDIIKKKAILIAREANFSSLRDLAIQFIFSNLSRVIDIGLVGVNCASSLNENVRVIHSRADTVHACVLEKMREISELLSSKGLHDPRNWN